MNVNEHLEYFYMRQYAYDLLRRLFIEEPTIELLTWLQKDENLTNFPGVDENQVTRDAIVQLQTYLSECHFVAGKADFEDLHWDFTRLFIGPESPQAPAWESVYVSRDKLLFQENTRNVDNFYQQYGFILNSKEREAADHIGFELDFLYQLSSQLVELIELEQTDNTQFENLLLAQKTFFKQHIMTFSADFCRKVYNHAETSFYRAISILLQQFLILDERNLNKFVTH